MNAAAPERMTADAFVPWAMRQRGRYELAAGRVVAMAPERVEHGLIKVRLIRLVCDEIDRLGLPCQAFVDSMAVRVDDATVYEPDVLVRCGPPLDPQATEVLDPMILFEVASPSTQGVDVTDKLVDYFRLESVRHYVMVSPRTRLMVHHERCNDGSIRCHTMRDGALALDPPGLRLAGVFD